MGGLERIALRALKLFLQSIPVAGIGPRLLFTGLDPLSRLVDFGQPPAFGSIITFIGLGALGEACLLFGLQTAGNSHDMGLELFESPLRARQGLVALTQRLLEGARALIGFGQLGADDCKALLKRRAAGCQGLSLFLELSLASLQRLFALLQGLVAGGHGVVQCFVSTFQGFIPEQLQRVRHALRQLREFLPGEVADSGAEPPPPGIEVLIDGVGRAAPQADAYPVNGGAMPLDEQRVGGREDIGL